MNRCGYSMHKLHSQSVPCTRPSSYCPHQQWRHSPSQFHDVTIAIQKTFLRARVNGTEIVLNSRDRRSNIILSFHRNCKSGTKISWHKKTYIAVPKTSKTKWHYLRRIFWIPSTRARVCWLIAKQLPEPMMTCHLWDATEHMRIWYGLICNIGKAVVIEIQTKFLPWHILPQAAQS